MPRQPKPHPLKRQRFVGEFTYDPKADATYIYLSGPIAKGGAAKTRAINGDSEIYIDLDKGQRLIGIEILAHDRMPPRMAARVKARKA